MINSTEFTAHFVILLNFCMIFKRMSIFIAIYLLVWRVLPCLPPTWLLSPFPPVASLWAGGQKRQKRKARREKRKEKEARGRGKPTWMDGWWERANRRSKRRKTGGPKGGMRNKKTNLTAGEEKHKDN